MLYDPKWEVKADPEFDGVTLSGLIAFLQTKDPLQRYEYANPLICAAAQYKASIGYRGNDVLVSFGLCPMPGDAGFWLFKILGSHPYTFGAALERACAMQSK